MRPESLSLLAKARAFGDALLKQVLDVSILALNDRVLYQEMRESNVTTY
jgi:hypothetical protein